MTKKPSARRKTVRRHTKFHSTMGPVGGLVHFCFECNRDVINDDWREEMEALARIKAKELKNNLTFPQPRKPKGEK